MPPKKKDELPKTDAGWKVKLTPGQYYILREKGTEPPFTGSLLSNKAKGVYVCAGCGAELFSSETKFESGTGWPSFYDVYNSKNVELHKDSGFLMERVEVLCKRCGGHLGHVFDDGPKPTGKRFCINSDALLFQKTPKEKWQKKR